MNHAKINEIADLARDVRLQVLLTIKYAGMGHIGGDFSVTDILATPFNAVLKVDPKNPNKEDRDRLILRRALTRSIEIIKYLEEVCDRIDINELNQARNAQDALAAQATIWDAIMREKRLSR